jgi:N-acetylmuramoyl-L-alanine amidase
VIVTKKPTDVKIIWLNDSSAEVNWLPPLYTDVEDALVSGYEVFYETKSDAYVMSSGITRDTKVIINVKRNLLFGNFHVVAFTNQPFVLPSELAITGKTMIMANNSYI